ncbi:MAG: nucleoside triphosphate pyrophosphohydrolase [Anaerolineaceae bacterium]|nr:nucleoside triphosphate pyrophosphohydrolase [Anaerolineaceae bacterium]
MEAKGIVLLGLGPGQANLITREAWDWLGKIDQLYLRTTYHPAVAELPGTISRHSFDAVYETGESFESVYEEIIATVLDLGKRPEGVTYAVPGHPFVTEETCPEIYRRAKKLGIPVRVIEGLSFIEPTFRALELDPFPQVTLVDALKLARMQTPSFPPSQPALIAQIYSREVASDVKLTLMSVFPDEHLVQLIHAAGTDEERIEHLPLYAIDQSAHLGLLSSLYIPALENGSAFEDFQEIIARLRAPGGCPWDREQTHISLKPFLLEETYEALEALDLEDMQLLKEELGDILLQVVLHAQIAEEDGDFNMSDVLQAISDKMQRRHPHVFSDGTAKDVDGVIQKWEEIKADERKDNHHAEKKGMLDGIPLNLPALVQAQHIQERARRIGFDWPEISGVLKKVEEELLELNQAQNEQERRAEAGDLLFAVVNLARWLDVEAESALRESNRRFKKRFAFIEQSAEELGKALNDLTFEEMDALWEQAKLKFKSDPV